jgi:4-aminobutyrate aminotransferase-like enzyme
MRGEALIERREAAVARGLATAHPIFAESARGIRLRDVDGGVDDALGGDA